MGKLAVKAEPRIEAGFHIPNTVGCIGCEAIIANIVIYCAVSISHALYLTSAKALLEIRSVTQSALLPGPPLHGLLSVGVAVATVII